MNFLEISPYVALFLGPSQQETRRTYVYPAEDRLMARTQRPQRIFNFQGLFGKTGDKNALACRSPSSMSL